MEEGLQELSFAAVDSATRLHMRSLSSEDLSVALGENAVRRFYRTLVDSSFAKCFIVVHQQEVVALSTVCTDYPRLQAQLKVRLLFAFARSCLLHPLKSFEWMGALLSHNPIRADARGCVVGMIIRDKALPETQSRHFFNLAYRKARAWLDSKSPRSMWASTRSKNLAARHFFLKEGFLPVGESRGVVYFEKDFSV